MTSVGHCKAILVRNGKKKSDNTAAPSIHPPSTGWSLSQLTGERQGTPVQSNAFQALKLLHRLILNPLKLSEPAAQFCELQQFDSERFLCGQKTLS